MVVFLSAAAYLWDRARSDPVSSGADEPATQVTAAPAVPDDRVATASPNRRGNTLLPADIATAQRAVAAESRKNGPRARGTLSTPATRDMPATPLPQVMAATTAPEAVPDAPTPPTPAPHEARDTPAPSSRATSGTITQAPQITPGPPTVQSGNAPPTPRTGMPGTQSLPTDRASAVSLTRAVAVVAGVETDASRVLALAARIAGPDSDDKIRQSARSMHAVTDAPLVPSQVVGRRLNADARIAWERQDIDTALRLQQRAFEANSADPEIAGNLAFLYLKVKPPQPARARQLALHALAARGRAFPAGRVEDWGTLAVASSLVGREADAIDAMYVMFATSTNPERACRAALMAVEQYGVPMQAPANAMLTRVRARGAIPGAPSCR